MPHLSKGDKRAKTSANEARRRKECALAELREMEVRKRRGDLVELTPVNAYIGGIILRAAEVLDRIPDELADRLAQTSDPVACKELLRRELNRARGELAEYRSGAEKVRTRGKA